MVNDFVRSFPARGLVVPVIRALVAIIKAEKERVRYAPARPPVELDQEVSCNAEQLARTIERLAEIGGVRDSALPRVTGLVREFPTRGVDISAWNTMLDEVVGFCVGHHEIFREAANEEKGLFREDYRERVCHPSVLLLHGGGGGSQATSIATSLRDGCYYDVDPLRYETRTPSTYHDLKAMYAQDTRELRRAVPEWTPDVVLSDVGSPKRGFDMKMGRFLARLDRTKVSVLYRPFSANRLLGCFEGARMRKLAS